ncbi:hypothetical protein [Streptomyces sp. NPDC001478]
MLRSALAVSFVAALSVGVLATGEISWSARAAAGPGEISWNVQAVKAPGEISWNIQAADKLGEISWSAPTSLVSA